MGGQPVADRGASVGLEHELRSKMEHLGGPVSARSLAWDPVRDRSNPSGIVQSLPESFNPFGDKGYQLQECEEDPHRFSRLTRLRNGSREHAKIPRTCHFPFFAP